MTTTETVETKTCLNSRCRKPFTAYFIGTRMPSLCRRCERRYQTAVAKGGRKTMPEPEAASAAALAAPAHVRGKWHWTAEWYAAQQDAWVRHMAELGIPKSQSRPTAYSAAGE